MTPFEIRAYSDSFHPDLTVFRERIYREDLNANTRYIHSSAPTGEIKASVPAERAEDVYKFSFKKWNKTNFDRIYCVMDGGQVVGMSGTRKYGRYLRVSMHMYLLKRFRGKFINLKYLPGGYFERQVNYARELDLEAVFFSIFSHNDKTRALVINHTRRKISSDLRNLHYPADLQRLSEPVMFKDVPQHIFYLPLKGACEFNVEYLNDRS